MSPSRQFSLLHESDRKPEHGNDIGRFSLALHACMTPREEEQASCELTTEQANENYFSGEGVHSARNRPFVAQLNGNQQQ